ncbi:MAG: hypothetical protein Ct9H300mP1_32190 [Planctomycetaceae bacterium]|nr:MAG: hypothetical protein Ct9H300mP1_32190 [Planctomycetaceae bacterium]
MDHDCSRRGFLAGASATAMTGSLLANRTAPSETIRIGLIGCGGIMNAHSRASATSPPTSTSGGSAMSIRDR